MVKRITHLILTSVLLFNLCGCVALVAGTAGGAGTAFWLGGKIDQQVNASLTHAVEAVTKTFDAMRLKITKTTVKDEVAQIMGEYSDGRTIWVDVHKISNKSSRIEIRVGATGDKAASRKILDKIKRYL